MEEEVQKKGWGGNERIVFIDNLFMGPEVLYLILAVMNLKKK